MAEGETTACLTTKVRQSYHTYLSFRKSKPWLVPSSLLTLIDSTPLRPSETWATAELNAPSATTTTGDTPKRKTLVEIPSKYLT